MGESQRHPFLKFLVLFLGLSYAFFSVAASVPATRSVKEVAVVKTEPFSGSALQEDGGEPVEGEGGSVEGRVELEKVNDYPEPGPNPRHYPPPIPSRS